MEKNLARDMGEEHVVNGKPLASKKDFNIGTHYREWQSIEEAYAAYSSAYGVLSARRDELSEHIEFGAIKEKGGAKNYDWRVLRDGKHIATFRKAGHENSYYLIDGDKLQIRVAWANSSSTHTVKAKQQSQFLAVIARYIDIIPNDDQLAAAREARAQNKRDKIAAEKAEATAWEEKKRAPEMAALLRRIAKGKAFQYAQTAADIRDLIAALDEATAVAHRIIDEDKDNIIDWKIANGR